jgi:hypothetical protein
MEGINGQAILLLYDEPAESAFDKNFSYAKVLKLISLKRR